MSNRAILAFVVAAALGAVVWALSIPITGQSEPWDAESPYYFVALGLAGAISGALVPKHLGVQYAGVVSGQVAYELAFLKFGPLFFLGLVFLSAYSIIFLAVAAITVALRNRGSNGPTAV